MPLQKSPEKPYKTSLLILFTVVKNGKKSGGRKIIIYHSSFCMSCSSRNSSLLLNWLDYKRIIIFIAVKDSLLLYTSLIVTK